MQRFTAMSSLTAHKGNVSTPQPFPLWLNPDRLAYIRIAQATSSDGPPVLVDDYVELFLDADNSFVVSLAEAKAKLGLE